MKTRMRLTVTAEQYGHEWTAFCKELEAHTFGESREEALLKMSHVVSFAVSAANDLGFEWDCERTAHETKGVS